MTHSTMRQLDAVKDELREELKKLRLADGKDQRSPILKRVAHLVLELRQHFLTPEGEPDWAGTNGTYRLAMRELYSDAAFPPELINSTQSAVRYHLSTIQRETLTEEQLDDAGLQKASLRERGHERDKQRSSLVQAAKKLNVPGTTDTLRGLIAAQVIVDQTTEKSLISLDTVQQNQAIEALDKLAARVAELRELLAGQGAGRA
ncbi:hypothetical protein GCM10010168_53130 [Actinoplanes ianthinogenes]|uniref:Uncharacterized protein n=1 Tax=Actinoplanes ianthinogenes TaxID=122358 RepID=A0ABM7LR07_9ACTN|nr:hypothetical protein [Actinoplanes ianthinogenes]BCJ41689.1 hypothetical protein Aiant_23460 [Actinoplanes ianthinogenes]GGR28392.1 hypothetical protein GCM10010168_53130 [Actinoplanes ianthinogenes]